ncbi:hypothetical protein AVEN_137891-1 [Araneus ventricosus]|uniref:Uncharacterized protein n=1 Tax=Araneus ventricosus TaxID=182803 RepID=A0A4Y2FG45_ARAVE|nr:hypothetical protein AVEN_137891-1 [Araneus ventricosus]
MKICLFECLLIVILIRHCLLSTLQTKFPDLHFQTLPSVCVTGQLISSCGDPPQKQPTSSVSSRESKEQTYIHQINKRLRIQEPLTCDWAFALQLYQESWKTSSQ